MFEKWAILLANRIKEINPEETAPHDVLVFGFTIILNLLFTFFLLFFTGWLLGKPFIIVQVTLSFLLLRMLTGGSHLTASLACSIMSLLFILSISYLPINTPLIITYSVLSFFFLLQYAPFYESHQVIHSKEWERKKKLLSLFLIFIASGLYFIFHLPGFVLGAFLQSLLLTPIGINFIYFLDRKASKGGDQIEKSS
ncbi:accessory gene regulator ArgB-like protein [Bacillus sp. 03113]|uniref:accessory gene regulator ArgB-like protein n=1 Tax=Bacillus sp. 03113 TaxID=2578211 RepID=UPI001143DA9F|nr:accessory gene regulator B family protein [Bacillus sp. 03113]